MSSEIGDNCNSCPQPAIFYKLTLHRFCHDRTLFVLQPAVRQMHDEVISVFGHLLQHSTVFSKRDGTPRQAQKQKKTSRKYLHLQTSNQSPLTQQMQKAITRYTLLNKQSRTYAWQKGNRFTMDISRADPRRTTSHCKTLQGTILEKYWVLTIRSMSPITWKAKRGNTIATPSRTELPITLTSLQTSSTRSRIISGVCVWQAKNDAEPWTSRLLNTQSAPQLQSRPNEYESHSRTPDSQPLSHPSLAYGKQHWVLSSVHGQASPQHIKKPHLTSCSIQKTPHEGIR